MYQQSYFSLIGETFNGPDPVTKIFITNALGGEDRRQIGRIYPLTCKINHSCVPNAVYHFNMETNRLNLHAVYDIAEGEELGISYTGLDLGYGVTIAQMFLSFG